MLFLKNNYNIWCVSMSKDRSSPELAKLLAILLVEQESFSYIDKLSQTSSKDLALYYLREALRDYHSLANRGFEKRVVEDAAKFINFNKIEQEIAEINEFTDLIQLRGKLSFVAAEALAKAGEFIRYEEKYQLAKKVVEYIKSSNDNLPKDDANLLSKIIEEKSKEISEALKVPEKVLINISEDERLLNLILERGQR